MNKPKRWFTKLLHCIVWILLAIVLTTSVVFACDHPHVEVFGFKIGYPLENKETFKIETQNKEAKIVVYTKKLSGIFDTVKIIELNDNVEIIELSAYENTDLSLQDIDELVTAIDKKYGAHIQQGVGVFFWDLEKGIISNIDVFTVQLDDRNVLDLTYQSRRIVDFMRLEFKKSMYGG